MPRATCWRSPPTESSTSGTRLTSAMRGRSRSTESTRPTGLAFSPDGTTLAAGIKTVGAEIRLWRVSDGTLLRRFKSQKSTSVAQISFSPDGKLLAAAGFQGPLVLFDVGNGKELDSFGKEFDLLADYWTGDSPVAFSPDRRTLATLGGREALHFWDLATGKDRLATPEAHLGGVYALAFPADGKTLISGSDDRTVRVWDLATGPLTNTLAHDGWVRSLAVSADGSFLAAVLAYPEGNPSLEPQDWASGSIPGQWRARYRAECDAQRRWLVRDGRIGRRLLPVLGIP